MSRFRPLARVVLAPLFLLVAGCAVLPGMQSAPPATPDHAAVSTQVAAAVAATVAALTPGTTASTSPSGGDGNPPAPAGSTPRAATATSTVKDMPATATGVPATPPPSATPRPSTTPRPSPTTPPTATATPVILAPIQLAQAEVGGGALLPRYWTNTRAIRFTMAAAPGTTAGLLPEVELEPLGRPYMGTPTARGAPLPPAGTGSVTITVASLPEGSYHWRARLGDGAGHNGPWAEYYQGPAFRLDRTPPSAPVIHSSTDPDQHATYGSPMAELSWTKPAAHGPIQGYQTSVDRDPAGSPSGAISNVTTTSLGPLRSGTLYFHVRAVDYAGNLGAIATFTLHIDHRVPAIAYAHFDQYQFNPQFDRLTMHFVFDKTVRVQVGIREHTSGGTVAVLDAGTANANQRATVTWNGRDFRGAFVPAGLYTMVITATDSLGNVGYGYYSRLGVNYRRIVVHLGSQSMDVYDGSTLLRSALVTTGNQHLPTPVGVWHIITKYHPYSFLSPWKKGSPFWYPTTPVSYAMGFHAGGYFLHDATWRSVFGPGTNSSPGLPGSGIYAGSHGCVEMTLDMAQWLYNWAPFGTVVQVVAQ